MDSIMEWKNRMSEITTAPGAAIAEAVKSAQIATVPALVGLIGASASLPMGDLGLPLFFVAASLPMSLFGLGLGFWQRNEAAMIFGMAGITLAAIGFVLG